MTQRQAWLTMARAYETDEDKRTEEQLRLTEDGICGGAYTLYSLGKITLSIEQAIRLNTLLSRELGAYLCPLTPANDALRADYCRFQYYRLGGK